MQIESVSAVNLRDAAKVHAAAWRASHRSICSEAFIAEHTTERQMGYIQGLLDAGKRFFLLRDNAAIAVVAVQESVISDLYVHPEQQRNGYGTLLLSHAIKQCEGIPTLWVLNINRDAKRLYERMGFAESGRIKQLKNNLFEIEMIYQKG